MGEPNDGQKLEEETIKFLEEINQPVNKYYLYIFMIN